MTRLRGLFALSFVACASSPSPVATRDAAKPARAQKRINLEPLTTEDDDEDDEDDLTVAHGRGRLSPKQVQAALAPYANEISACYASQVQGRRWLGGDVEIKWWLKADGAQLGVALTKNTLGAWDIERCMLEQARMVKFPAPKGGATDVVVPLALYMSRVASVVAWELQMAELGEQLSQLHECSKLDGSHAPRRMPVRVEGYVGEGGAIVEAGFMGDDAPPKYVPPDRHDGWFTCAAGVMKRWRVRDPQGRIARFSLELDMSKVPHEKKPVAKRKPKR